MTITRSTEPASNTPSTSPFQKDDPRRRQMSWIAAVVLGVVGIVIIVAVASNDDNGDQATTAPLVLTMGEGEASASCLPFDVEILAAMSQAFAGTVTTVGPDMITIRVDDWYAGGDATTVELRTVTDAQALLGGFPVAADSQYLFTAADGALSYCGYSGPATPELTAAYDTAFGGGGS